MHLQKKMTILLGNPDNVRILERELTKKPTKNQLPENTPSKPNTSINSNKNQSEIGQQKAKLNNRKLK